MRKIRQRLTPIALFLRFEYLVFALMLPLLGGASVQQQLNGTHVIWLILSAFCFHIFISVQNDIYDLQLDRTDPRRRNYPLVTGAVSVEFASVLVGLQVPLVFVLCAWWGMSQPLSTSAILVFGMLSIYNMFGKRTRLPIFTDLVQGIGFAALILFGSFSTGHATLLSAIAFWGVVIWMMQTNHLGGLRDLQSDYLFDTFTTPISLGSKYRREGFFISRKSIVYSYLLLFIQFVVPAVFLVRESGSIDPAFFATVIGILVLVLVAAVRVLHSFFEIGSRHFRVEFDLAYVVMYLSALPMMAVLALNKNPWVFVFAGVVILAAFKTYYRVTQRIRGDLVVRPASSLSA